MNHVSKRTLTALLALALVIALGWLQFRATAQDEAPTGEEGLKAKLAQLAENNAKTEETLKTIEANLQFAKSRAMSGGRH